MKHPDSGKTYYHSPSRRKSTWDLTKTLRDEAAKTGGGAAAAGAGAGAAAAAAGAEAKEVAPPGDKEGEDDWDEVHDPTSGATFLHSSSRNRSVWNRANRRWQPSGCVA